jgi:hypothetical protein
MKSRILCAAAIGAGLALLVTLGLTISARGIGTASQLSVPGNGRAEAAGSARAAARLDRTSEVSFTPVTTLHFPVVFNSWNPCAVTPTLIAPPDGVNLYTIAPLFRWDAGDNPYATQLRLRISEDPEFDEWVKGVAHPSAQGKGSFRFHDNFDPDTTYYWRAWLVCGELESLFSEVWSFRTGAEGTLPSAPTLTVPDDGATTSSPSVTLSWEPVTRTAEYLVRYREVGGGYRWVWTSDTQSTLNLSGSTTYEWWVAARNDYGIGPDSATWRFTTPTVSSVAAQDEKRETSSGHGGGIVIETP